MGGAFVIINGVWLSSKDTSRHHWLYIGEGVGQFGDQEYTATRNKVLSELVRLRHLEWVKIINIITTRAHS